MNPPRWKKVTKRTKLMSVPPPYLFIYFVYLFIISSDTLIRQRKFNVFSKCLHPTFQSSPLSSNCGCVHCRFLIYFRNRAINLWTNSFHKNNIVQKNANAVVKSAFVFEINNENVCSVLVQFVWLVMQKFFRSIKSIDVWGGGAIPDAVVRMYFLIHGGGVSNIRNCTKESEAN